MIRKAVLLTRPCRWNFENITSVLKAIGEGTPITLLEKKSRRGRKEERYKEEEAEKADVDVT